MLYVSDSPHIHSADSTHLMMWHVFVAMLPMFVVSILFFGLSALIITLTSVVCCCLFQWVIERFVFHRPSMVGDGSAVVTGMLLAFNVPATPSMYWIIIIGALVSMGIGKMAFGGLGHNPFNPALVGRVFMLISFPVQMTTWPVAKQWISGQVDAMTGPTPLGLIKETIANGGTIADVSSQLPSWGSYVLGSMGGSLGEVSALAIIAGGVYLLCCKVITWRIPVSFIGAAFLLSGLLWLVDADMYLDPLHTLLSGGLLLGAFFMATDMVTSPMSHSGQLVFGIGCGLLTVVIRTWGAYPEGVSFAILLMNAVTPLINKGFRPKRFSA
ncbi:MAG: RnfABCDGE type electron transport complex subunit D [Bacteroidales bacterium]|nr:RnfABCDGE type electron transport complex subunit D [Candidatus Colimorpha onthohippi]